MKVYIRFIWFDIGLKSSPLQNYLGDIFPEKCITFCFKFNSKEESSVTSDENNFENSKITGNLI